MHYQPSPNVNRNDVVFTPNELAEKIVNHFKPSGSILDPASGEGVFLDLMPGADWCEISKGRNFFEWTKHVDWIVTNPPWSKIREYLQHGYEVADNIVYLITVNHVFTKARIREMRKAGFGIKEIFMFDTPSNFPQSGFQLGAIYWKRGHGDDAKITYG